MPSPPAPLGNATTTTFQVGTYNALTDTFTTVTDLNDQSTFYIKPGTLKLSQPKKVWVTSSNVRTAGQRIVRPQYLNRTVSCTFSLRGSTVQTMLNSIHSALVKGVENPPYVIRFALPGATQYTYFDVVKVEHEIPADPILFLNKALIGITIAFECYPGLRGDRQILSNLCTNPGFEAPTGGGTTAGLVAAFNDPLGNVNAYTVVAGSAPTLTPALTFVDFPWAQSGANLLRYYRLGEASGSTATDIGGTLANGTYTGSPTLGATGLVSGDTGKSATLNGTSQYVSCPTTGLPTGAGKWTMACLTKPTNATNAGNAHLMCFGNPGTNGAAAFIAQHSSGGWDIGTWGGAGRDFTANGTSVAAHTYMVAGTFDGTNLDLYVGDITAGASSLTHFGPFTPTAPNVTLTTFAIGQAGNGTLWYPGSMQEAVLWNTNLSSGQLGNIYTAAKSGATGTLANAMTVAAASTLTYGSSTWGASQQQIRFRWSSSITTINFFLHRVDGSNQLELQLNAPTNFQLVHRVAGTAHVLATAVTTLVHEAWYWLVVNQFPSVSGSPPYVQATLYSDDNNAIGSQVGTCAAGAFDAVTALAGVAGLNVTGAALVVSGGSLGVGMQTSLFGPGGWIFSNYNSLTPVAGAWDQNTANTAPIGTVNAGNGSYVQVPVTSYGAARMDLPPAGTVDAAWHLYNGGTPAGTQAIPATQNQLISISALVKSAGLGVSASSRFVVAEYNSSGTFLTSGNAAGSVQSGNYSSWTAVNGTYSVQSATCAYIDVGWRVTDNGGGDSPNGTVWVDNVIVWNYTVVNTATGQTAMPYCELRFANSPAQLLLSGLAGDLPAPTAFQFGTYLAAWNTGSLLNFAVGRMAAASQSAILVAPSHGYYGAGGSSTAVLDNASYANFYAAAATFNSSSWTTRPFSLAPADAPGIFQLFERFWTSQSTGNIGNVEVRANTIVRSQTYWGQFTNTDELWNSWGAWLFPLTAGSTWTAVGAGQVNLPPSVLGSLTDPTQNFLTPFGQWADNTGGGSTARANWSALIPIDASLITGVVNNPTNAGNVTTQWLWGYFDGLSTQQGQQTGAAMPGNAVAWTYSLESGPTPNAAHSGGGPGSQATGTININAGADPFFTVDPRTQVAQTGLAGVNQMAAFIADGATAAVLPFHAEIQYSPLYLYPR